MAVGWNRDRWLFPALATGKEKDHNKKQRCCRVGSINKPSLLIRRDRAHLRGIRKRALFLECFDLCGALVGEVRPNTPGTFPLLDSDNRARPAIRGAAEMQNQVLARALCICEVIKIYDAAIRRAHKIHSL